MGVEYPHVMVINIRRFSIFHKKFPWSEMGVADLDFTNGVEFSNFYQFFYIPSRNISCTQTFIRNLFTVDAFYYSLTIGYNKCCKCKNDYRKGR